MTIGQKPFIGEALPLGGTTEEELLAQECPAEFNSGNEWSNLAATLFYEGGDPSKWTFRPEIEGEEAEHVALLHGMLGSMLHHTDKINVSGWMLREMLSEIPG